MIISFFILENNHNYSKILLQIYEKIKNQGKTLYFWIIVHNNSDEEIIFCYYFSYIMGYGKS